MMLRAGMVTQKSNAVAPAVLITPVGVTHVSTTNASEYTFSGCGLGDAADTKYIAVAVGTYRSGAAPSLTSVVIDGVTATPAEQSVNSRDLAAILVAQLSNPAHTSGDIVVTFSAAVRFCSLDVFVVDGVPSVTPSDTAANDASGLTVSNSLDVPANGGVIAAAAWQVSSGNHINAGSGYGNFEDAQTGLSIGVTGAASSASWSGVTQKGFGGGTDSIGANQIALCSASFGPPA